MKKLTKKEFEILAEDTICYLRFLLSAHSPEWHGSDQ